MVLRVVDDALATTASASHTVRLCCFRGQALAMMFRWQEAAACYDRAEAALSPDQSAEQAIADTTLVTLCRAQLDINRGLPDLALEKVQAVKRGLPRSTPRSAYDLGLVELQLLRALDLPAAARQRLAEHEAEFGPSPSLRLRVALSVLQDPAATAAELEQFRSDAADYAERAPEERALAHTVAVLVSLTTGDHVAARRWLATNRALLESAGLARADERWLTQQGLELQLALDDHAAIGAIAAAAADLEALWDDVLAAWSRQLPERGGLGALFPPERQRVLRELLRADRRLFGEAAGTRRALQRVLDLEPLGSTARALGVAPTTVAAVQRSLAEDRGALVYVAGLDHVWLFVIDGGQLAAFELPHRVAAIERRARSWLQALSAHRRDPARSEDLRRLERELAEALLPAELAPRLAHWRRVAIVGLESLGYVPFEVLPWHTGVRFGGRFAVSYLPSLTVGSWQREARPATPPSSDATALLLACPDARPEAGSTQTFDPLPFTADDQDLLVAPAGERRMPVLDGERATLPSLQQALPGTRLLAMLGHGVRDERRQDPQGFLLGDGSTAWSTDFERLPLPEYLVLGACRAGRGRIRRGDDGRNLLPGAALIGGARGVVSPWVDVDYRATLSLMRELHRGLFERGLPLDEALRQARLAVAGPDEHGPIDAWLFHLYGVGDTPLCPPPGLAAPSPWRTWAPWLMAWLFAALLLLTPVVRRARAAQRRGGG
ncbi:MAG: CHAT domain-containing protein [Planctomycetes bacterium]|nr:CHAT domain-containing protein [Planctomycetota bacterium]